MKRPIVLCLYDLTGAGAQPWLEAGCDVVLVDLQHPNDITDSNGVIRMSVDLMDGWQIPEFIKERCIFVMCWTPCDHMAVSGARWFKGKGLRKLAEAINCCATGAEIINELGVPGFIENPVSTLSTYWRQPDYKFHPYDYTGFAANDNYSKQTCLWAFDGFVMPEPNRLLGLGAPDDRIHKCPPGPERHNIRSATPTGFARAVFEANKHLVSANDNQKAA